MTNDKINSIIYQSQIYYRDLINSLVRNKKVGKAYEKKWAKAKLILSYLKALNYRDRLDDSKKVEQILFCLITLCELNRYPVSSPLSFTAAPSILYGLPGPIGPPGATGAKGDNGLATDFQAISVVVTSTVDTFPYTDANGARWDYLVMSNTGAARAGTVIAVWDSAGTVTQFSDTSTDDIVGATTQLEFNVQFFSGNVLLVAVISGGTWSIKGSRYYIPNNGNGTGPISDNLSNGQVFIGNASNVATARTLSGAVTITNTGVASLGVNTVSDVNIIAGANIAITKLAPMTINRLLITDGTGVITATASPTLTELGYLAGVSSLIQTQLNLKLTDPMTTIGDVIYRNLSNNTVRLGIGTAGQVLTVSGGIPVWQNSAAGITGLTVGRIPFAASPTTLTDDSDLTFTGGNTLNVPNISAPTVLTLTASTNVVVNTSLQVNNGIRTNTDGTGEYWKEKIISIGDWDMDTNQFVSVAHGVTLSKIRGIKVIIRRDDFAQFYDIYSNGGGTINAIDSSVITLQRFTSGSFDNTNFDVTGATRGWIVLTHTI